MMHERPASHHVKNLQAGPMPSLFAAHFHRLPKHCDCLKMSRGQRPPKEWNQGIVGITMLNKTQCIQNPIPIFIWFWPLAVRPKQPSAEGMVVPEAFERVRSWPSLTEGREDDGCVNSTWKCRYIEVSMDQHSKNCWGWKWVSSNLLQIGKNQAL